MSFRPYFSQMTCLVIASKNMHKVREFREIMKPLKGLDILSLCDFPQYAPPEEIESTFEANAVLKATHAAQTLGHWTLADDSGLVVPALHGEPGVFSSRYAGKHATDSDNRKKLLANMQHLLDDDRFAYYSCYIALATPTGLQKSVQGTCEGKILMQERGGGGFGYDPLFVKHEYSKTFAELESSVKNRISHRRKALDKLIASLESLSSQSRL